MTFDRTSIEGALLIRLASARDERGSFARLFCAETFRQAGIAFRVAQASLSRNTARHTLRGLHHQIPPHAEGKIVRCSRGRIFDVVVDLRPESGTYLKWQGFDLDAARDEVEALLLPPGVAHGFLTLEPDSEVEYFMDAPYAPEAASGIRYDDPTIGVDWPAAPAVISDRDRSLPLLGGGDLRPRP